MGQGDSARVYDPSESMENAGILDVFTIFHTARLGQKIRRSPQSPLCGVALSLSLKLQWRDLAQWEMVYVEQSLQVMSKQER